MLLRKMLKRSTIIKWENIPRALTRFLTWNNVGSGWRQRQEGEVVSPFWPLWNLIKVLSIFGGQDKREHEQSYKIPQGWVPSWDWTGKLGTFRFYFKARRWKLFHRGRHMFSFDLHTLKTLPLKTSEQLFFGSVWLFIFSRAHKVLNDVNEHLLDGNYLLEACGGAQ